MGLHVRYRICGTFCPFLLNTPNCKSTSGDQLIFLSNNENLSLNMIWTLSYFTEGGRFVSFVHISAVNWMCWLTAALYTIWWKTTNQYLIFLCYFSIEHHQIIISIGPLVDCLIQKGIGHIINTIYLVLNCVSTFDFMKYTIMIIVC